MIDGVFTGSWGHELMGYFVIAVPACRRKGTCGCEARYVNVGLFETETYSICCTELLARQVPEIPRNEDFEQIPGTALGIEPTSPIHSQGRDGPNPSQTSC
jgi:hypothetical protein